MTQKKLFTRTSVVALLAANLWAVPALAQDDGSAAEQDQAEEDDRIVVTGTRFTGIDPVGSPVIGLGRAEIEESSATTTTELLLELPQVFSLGANDASFTSANNQNANRTFGTGINLRGLGTESTLTLLDGRRLPAAGTMGQYFDPSVIPTAAIARLEVLADGSSGIYGSDAVGGVVNILLRKGFQGFEVSGRAKFADGFNEYQVGGAFGQDWGSGSLMVAAEFTDRQGLPASEREYYTDDLRPYGGTDQRTTNTAPGNVTVGGVTYAIPDGQDGTSLTPGDFTAGTRNLESRYLGTEILPPQQRQSYAATFEQDLADWLTFSAQGIYGKRVSNFERGALTANATVPMTNPFYVNPANNGQPVSVSYSFINELGPSLSESSQEFFHYTGQLTARFGAWKAEAFYARGKDKERSVNPTINGGALNAALADTNPATALNLFSSNGNNNPATIQGLLGTFQVDTDNILDEYGITLDGPVFELPSGDVLVAVGAARQEIRFIDYSPFPNDQTRDVNSLFGEVFVPLLGGDGPELDVSAAVRYDDYDSVGSTTNPKIGLTFRPSDSISFRASYGTSFRAPSLSDTGNPFNVAEDFVNADGTGTRRVLFIRGGNPTLQPETATTWSLGVDFEPVTIDGLTFSATYYNVDYTNRIATPGNDRLAFQKPELAFLIDTDVTEQEALAILNGPGFFGNTGEDPSNFEAIVDGRKTNVGTVQTEGMEFIGAYRTDTDWGSFRTGFNLAWIWNYDRALTPTTPLVDIVDTINNPRGLRGRAYVGSEFGALSATVFANYQGSYDTPTTDVPSHTEFDLALRYTLEDLTSSGYPIMTLTLDVQDIFDNDPPIVINGFLPYDSNSHSAIGRTVSVGARLSF